MALSAVVVLLSCGLCGALEHSAKRRLFAVALASALPAALVSALPADAAAQFERVSPLQFIAALGDGSASSGGGAQDWGLWRKDPGPRGVRLAGSPRLAKSGKADAGWTFDARDWWLEEHGLIMERPAPLPPGEYVVTGDRAVTTVLKIDDAGNWKLKEGTLYDVTHLPCRSARYTGESCSPESARQADFPVTPGAVMPLVPGCAQVDYAVLFVVGRAVKQAEL
ncbi:hypothetical protein M885DRAFT_526866 [Pelagophyceae sp. CCMP2097]|nr:hypothetical protein M885DRAFT_526866 [Pelagophyceae sp. CCMP2097]|mmetsp:Transcript_3622/g.11002  ORF Transcript_3622/g.11002 Transcript_3622/m.11002 type:complete len:224 (+) Transcript_3622:168-839(+)